MLLLHIPVKQFALFLLFLLPFCDGEITRK